MMHTSIISRVIRRVLRPVRQRVVQTWLRRLGVELGRGVVFHGPPIVEVAPKSRISIGDRSVLCSLSHMTALGINHPVVLRTLGPGASIEIGSDVGISGGSFCAVSRIEIGDGTLIGANVTIADTDFHSVQSLKRRHDKEGIATSPVNIGKNVFIGTGSIVLKGVSIGDNSVIGAGSVVSRSIPANSIAAGNPCRVLKPLFANELKCTEAHIR